MELKLENTKNSANRKPMDNQLIQSVAASFHVCLDILKKKNKDYSTDSDPYRNFNRCESLGIPCPLAIMIRFEDKVSRIENLLLKDRFVTEETIDDTINDAINYLAILKARLEYERNVDGSRSTFRSTNSMGGLATANPQASTLGSNPTIGAIGSHLLGVLCVVCKESLHYQERYYCVHGSYYHEGCFFESKV